ncbi:MAG: response regulator [Treponema sp.]|jgi:DNA-binding response OmpR family regulator|nr:response regulator [Treponema sp.]
MKQILVIDESPLFREYLWRKFSENAIDITLSTNGRDGLAKIRTMKPDLILLDYHISGKDCIEVLREKKVNTSIVDIPVIITASRIDPEDLVELAAYNVSKIFTKPIKIDALFGAISQLLDITFDLDASPGQVDVHINDNIIFIEISTGLNQDKLELLRFKILELMDLYRVRSPKILVMLNNTKLGKADGTKLSALFEMVMEIAVAGPQNIRALTEDAFVKTYLNGHTRFGRIAVAENITAAVEGLLGGDSGERPENSAEQIGNRLLSGEKQIGVGETVQLQFTTDCAEQETNPERLKEIIKGLKVAVVDDDFVIQELIKNAFHTLGADVSAYSNGEEYLEALKEETFNLTFLDIMMPKVDGLAVLEALQEKRIRQPMIVLSALSHRETVLRAYKLGIKSYMVKPLTPGAIFKKVIEILRANF